MALESFHVWIFIASRRSDRPLPPMFSAQLILLLGGMLLLGGATMGASGIVGGLAELVMVWIASMLTALGLGRTWDPFKTTS